MSAPQATHPTDQTLQAHAQGQLDDASARSVGSHLEGCPDCRRRAATIPVGQPRGARAGAESVGLDLSSADGLPKVGAAAVPAAPPAAGTLPRGLADHPDFEIVRELGRGGMGVVYLAQNTLMGRMEVLKVVGGQFITRPEVAERFLREIRSAARLQHTNIVTAYSVVRLPESLALAMEYIEGIDLYKLVKVKGPLPVGKACYYVYQAAQGLQHAYEHGMVHRDIKPSNLMLGRQGKKPIVKVLDFGLAKVTSEGQGDRNLTREGQMLGSPDYIAPEQIRDSQSADIRADIYSLGCTFYFLLTGGPPFDGDKLWDLYQAHLSRDAAPLNLARPEVPATLAALVAKMMAKEPADRFQTPGEVAAALAPFFQPGAKPPAETSGMASPSQYQIMPDRNAGNLGTSANRPVTAGPARVAPGPIPPVPGAAGEEMEVVIELVEDKPPPLIPKRGPAKPAPVPAEMPAGQPVWLWPAVAGGVFVAALVVGGAVVLTSRGKGEAGSSPTQPPVPTVEAAKVPDDPPAPAVDRSKPSSTLSAALAPPASSAKDRDPANATDPQPGPTGSGDFPAAIGTLGNLGATNDPKPEPNAPAGQPGAPREVPAPTRVAEAPRPAVDAPEPLAPGVYIQEDFTHLTESGLPAGWKAKLNNVEVHRGARMALMLRDASVPDRIELPRVDLPGDFTIDLDFYLPHTAGSAIDLHLQGTSIENLYLSILGDGTVETRVASKPYSLPSRGFRPRTINTLRLERKGGKPSVLLNGITVGDIRINTGQVHYKSLWLTFGPPPPRPDPHARARANLAGRGRAPTPPPRGPIPASPRIHSLRVAGPAPN